MSYDRAVPSRGGARLNGHPGRSQIPTDAVATASHGSFMASRLLFFLFFFLLSPRQNRRCVCGFYPFSRPPSGRINRQSGCDRSVRQIDDCRPWRHRCRWKTPSNKNITKKKSSRQKLRVKRGRAWDFPRLRSLSVDWIASRPPFFLLLRHRPL